MEEYKYLAIVKWSKNYITQHQLLPGNRFLSENELCSIHGVSRQTVRQALMLLESQNVIFRVRGSGTFVKPQSCTDAAQHASIGLISTYFSDYIFPSIVTGIEKVLKKNNLGMQLAITHNQVSEESYALTDMLSHDVQGLIIEPSKSALPSPNVRLYEEIRKRNIPIVFFNAKYPWADFPCVAMDDEAAGRIATNCLFTAGHRRVFGIFALDDIQGHLRYKGFTESCAEHGITTAEQNVMWYSTSERQALFFISEARLMRLISDASGIVCYNDKLAIDLINFCRSHGISVPGQVSVVGIDDSKLASICDVKLTTVRHPHQLLGEKAAERMLELISKQRDKGGDMLFTPELIERDSVKAINIE